VRVYHGTAKTLPKHYVARERLCLSATADYWVNAMDGKPFFVVSQPVDPGLLQVLELAFSIAELLSSVLSTSHRYRATPRTGRTQPAQHR